MMNFEVTAFQKILLCRKALRLSLALFACSIFFNSGRVFAKDQRAEDGLERIIPVNFRAVTLADALEVIQKTSGLPMAYQPSGLPNKPLVTFAARQKIKVTLKQLLTPYQLDYQIRNGYIVLIAASGKTAIPGSISPDAEPLQQTIDLNGKVRDQNGQPVPGVSVALAGQPGKSTQTDSAGRFILKGIPGDAVLQVSSIGYKTQTVRVAGQTNLSIILDADNAQLEEVVVVGYGTQRRTQVTGSVASVPMKELSGMPTSSVDQAMAGKIPGVQISQVSGTPGGGVKVNIRGSGSIGAGNDPLYVVDGFPVMNFSDQNNNLLSTIPSDDIASMEILKDASATAIYGSRGSNGVVLITTKSGKTGKAKVNLDTYYGVQTVRSESDPHMATAEQWAQFRKESITDLVRYRENREPTDADIPEEYRHPEQYGEGTNWFQTITGPSAVQNYNVSVDGGSETIKSRFSLGYFNQGGLVYNTGFERYNVTARINSNLARNIQFGINVRPTYIRSNYPFTTTYASDLTASPLTPVYQADGSFTPMAGSPGMLNVPNPLYRLDATDNTSRRFRTLFDSFVEYEVIPGVKLKSSINVDFLDSKGSTYNPSFIGKQGQDPPVRAVGTYFRSEGLNWLNENTINIDRSFGADKEHSLSGLLGFTVQKEYDETGSFIGTDFPDDNIRTLNAAATITKGTNPDDNTISRWSLLSYIARINYSYKDRYLLTATIRRDGSSRFGEDNRWGNFPSVSSGWRLTEEPFMQAVPFINELKLRAGYGFAGNFNIGNYTHLSQIGNDNYPFGGVLAGATAESNLGNRNLGWERSQQLDAGADMQFLKGRIALTVDYYRRLTKDMLLNVEIPYTSGFSGATVNLGELQNTGWEFALNTQNTTGTVAWSTNFNISFNRNKVLALNKENAPIYSGRTNEGSYTHITQVGQPIGQFYGFVFDGLYSEADIANPNVAKYDGAIPGAVKYRDINGDGNVQTLEDFAVIGSPWPDFVYGLTNTVTYKNFDLGITAAGSSGGQLMKSYTGYLHNIDGVFNVSQDVLDRWRSPEQPGNGRNPTTVGLGLPNVMFRDVSSLIIQDNSYFWIKNISLGYRLPESFLKGIISQSRIYFSVQNAFLFTKYDGDNPEVNNSYNAALTPGIDYRNYPVPRTFTLGVNLTF